MTFLSMGRGAEKLDSGCDIRRLRRRVPPGVPPGQSVVCIPGSKGMYVTAVHLGSLTWPFSQSLDSVRAWEVSGIPRTAASEFVLMMNY